MSTTSEYQSEMRQCYIWGSTGIVTSGIVWLVAALVAYLGTPQNAVWTLFIGAIFIAPVSTLLDRVLGARGMHSAGNPLGRLAMEGTVFMLMCLPLAYGLSLYRMEWFFPAVLMIIGGRYLTFATLFGTRIYWALGALLGGVAWLGFDLSLEPHWVAFGGGAAEVLFGLALFFFKRGKA